MDVFKIGASRAKTFPDFGAAVAQFAEEMTRWREHMANVGINPEAYQPYPRPQAHPDIVAAVAAVEGPAGEVERYAPSFEVVDDGPSPEMIARAKRAALAQMIALREREAIAAVIPSNRLRLLNLRIAAVRKRDSERHDEIVRKHHVDLVEFNRQRDEVSEKNNQTLLETTTRLARGAGSIPDEIEEAMNLCSLRFEELGDAPTIDPVAACCDTRPREDQHLLDRADTIQRDLNAIEQHAAELLDELEDLDAGALEGWIMRPFPEPTKA